MTRVIRLALVLVAAVLALPGAAAQTPSTPPFFFVQLSDPQFGMFTKNGEFSQETLNLELAIGTVNRWRPAFVVVTGDLVNKAGDAAQIAEYQRVIGRLDKGIRLFNVPGNHDVENEPTAESVAAYVQRFGRDYYSFTSGSVAAVVLNSSLIHSPSKAPGLLDAQLAWLRAELPRLGAAGRRHLVVFQHHPWFLKDPGEPDQYFNIPLVRRTPLLALFLEHGVSHLFSGHYHRNASGVTGKIQAITTGPVGMPLGEGTQSGVRVVIVRDSGLTHRYYNLGELPNQIEIKAP